MKKKEINLQTFASYMRYHHDIYNDYIETKNEDKLYEFVLLCDIIDIFRKELKSPRSKQIIEEYVDELKRHAEKLYDLCEQFGYVNDDDYYIITEYTDVIFAL